MLVLSFKRSKLNQQSLIKDNSNQLQSTYKNVPETFYKSAILFSSTSLPRSSAANTSSIFAEYQRLFGNVAVHTNPSVNQIAAALRFRPLSLGTALLTATTGKKRAKKTAGGFDFRTKQNQCTHKFCCLAEKDACRIPSVEDKLKLRPPGLGEREITLDRGCSASLLHEKL